MGEGCDSRRDVEVALVGNVWFGDAVGVRLMISDRLARSLGE